MYNKRYLYCKKNKQSCNIDKFKVYGYFAEASKFKQTAQIF